MNFGSVLVKKQVKVIERRITYISKERWNEGAEVVKKVKAEVRWDDQCGNGHNTFSITADVLDGIHASGGCCHEDVAEVIPELAPFIKWHLAGSDMPWGYYANTIFFAGDRDCWGMQKDEFRQFRNKTTGELEWTLDIPDKYMTWGEEHCVSSDVRPGPVTLEWKPYGTTGEGKERELDAARRAAVWLDATDEDLTAPGLKERLEARLPALMAEFRAAVESLGFTW